MAILSICLSVRYRKHFPKHIFGILMTLRKGMGGLDYASRLRSLGLFSIKVRLLRMDLIKIWKCFHMEVDLGLLGIFEKARDVGTREHAYKLFIPVCRERRYWEGEPL